MDRERLVEILWAGTAGNERKVLNALCNFVRGADRHKLMSSGTFEFGMLVPVGKMSKAIDTINSAGGRALAFRFRGVH